MIRNHRALKREVLALLQEDLPHLVQKVLRYPARQVINPLIGALCQDEVTRWKAVAAIGRVVARIAEEDIERARIVVRRFMWMLNEESGGMAWGVPEAMAESLALQRQLAEEYTSILISYIWPEGNYLEYPPAQRGVVWGVGRLAKAHPDLVLRFEGAKHVRPLLFSEDEIVQGLTLWALRQMGPKVIGPFLKDIVAALQELSLPEERNSYLLLDDLRLVNFVWDKTEVETLLQYLLDEN